MVSFLVQNDIAHMSRFKNDEEKRPKPFDGTVNGF